MKTFYPESCRKIIFNTRSINEKKENRHQETVGRKFRAGTCFIFMALLLGACSGENKLGALIAPITDLLNQSSAAAAFSNDINGPANLPPDVAVEQPPQANAGDAPVQGIIAMESARLGRGSRVDADVSVLRTEHRRELVLHKYARMETNRTARADSIRLLKRASILGAAEYNTIHLGRNANVANQVTPLGALPLLPPFISGTPGSQRIGYQDSPLAAGNYGKLRLRKKKTLVLTGGFYHFSDVRVSRKSSLICETICVVLVKHNLRAGHRATITSMSGATSNLIIYVEGEAQYHHGCPHHHHSSVRLSKRSNTRADIYALNGKLRIGGHASYRGNIIAKRVIVGRRARVESGARVPPLVAKIFKAGEAGMLEIPGEVRLEIPAGALDHDTVISIERNEQAGGGPRLPALSLGSVKYDMKPDGLRFNTPVSLTIRYNEGDFDFTKGSEDQLAVYFSETGEDYDYAGGVVDALANTVTTSISHFTIFTVGSFDTSGQAAHVTVQGTIAYLSDWGGGLKIFDVANPSTPTLLSTVAMPASPPGVAYKTAVRGNYAYIAAGMAGLLIADISNPSAPALIRQYLTVDTPWAISVEILNNNKVLLTGFQKFQVLDVSNPAAPVLENTLSISSFGYKLRVTGPTVFIEDPGAGGLRTIDISNLAAPQYGLSAGPFDFIFGYTVTGDHAFAGDRLYIADQTSGLRVFDISNPLAWILLGTLPITAQTVDITVSGERAYLAQQDGMRVVDIGNPAAMAVLDFFPTTDHVESTFISGNLAYMAAGNDGLRILDISDTLPQGPILSPVGAIPTSSRATAVVVNGGIAYTPDWQSGLHIANVGNPALPSFLSSTDTPDQASDIALKGNYAIIADKGSGVQIIDVANPGAATIAAAIPGLNSPAAIKVAGNFAYAASFGQFHVINVVNPATPSVAGTAFVPLSPYDLDVAGNQAYVADLNGRLLIMDISNPAAPSVTAVFNAVNLPFGVHADGNYLYIADLTAGLRILDISNPAAPVQAGLLSIPGQTTDVFVVGTRAYITMGSDGVAVVDISNPAAPVLLDSVATSYYALRLFVQGSYIYVAAESSGLQIIEIVN